MASLPPGDKPQSTEEQIVEALRGIQRALDETNKEIAGLRRATEELKPKLEQLNQTLRQRQHA